MLVYIFRFLYLPVGVCGRLRDESHGRQVIFMCFAALICQQFLPISKCRCTGFSDLPHTFPLFSPEISKLEAHSSHSSCFWCTTTFRSRCEIISGIILGISHKDVVLLKSNCTHSKIPSKHFYCLQSKRKTILGWFYD